jgi:hypothetical protein
VAKAGPSSAISCSVIGFPPDNRFIGIQLTRAVVLETHMPKGLVVEFGILLDLVGHARSFGDFIFLPSLIEIDEPLTPISAHRFTHDGRRGADYNDQWPIPEDWPSLWVRARLPRVFGFSPPLCANNWQPLVNAGFLAVRRVPHDEKVTAYAFACTEGYGPADGLQEEPLIGLRFSSVGPDAVTQAEIATAIWSLLLQDPADLEPFSDYAYHPCSGYTLVGYEQGLYFSIDASMIYWPETSDLQLAQFFPIELSKCPDCDGTGVEDWFPYNDDCQTCQGTGIEKR